jgi:succinoglycan biosynthesis transport protein ExoP
MGHSPRGRGMSPDHGQRADATLRDYTRVLWRRKWLILLVTLLTPAAAFVMSKRQTPVYQASAQVLLSNQNLAATLSGVTAINEDPVRLAQTQADLARTPTVAALTITAAHATGLTPTRLLASSSVTPASNSDVLQFSVSNRNPALAESLATAYAGQYTVYRRQIDTAAIQRALGEAQQHLSQLKKDGSGNSALYAGLADKVQTLQTMAALQTSNASVVRTATSATQTAPKTARNTVLGLALGLILGIGLAFLWETLDTRIRSADEIASRLALPLLGRLPAPPRGVRSKNHLVAIDEPTNSNAEAFRVLRTNLELVNLDRQARTIMVTSAVEGEGKSTTVANLAVTLARAGRRVALVDLDVRRPFLHTFFDLSQEDGLTWVALGRMPLEKALVRVPISRTNSGPAEMPRSNGNGGGSIEGFLDVLPSGPIPPNPGEFINGAGVGNILRQLREQADVVLVDAPPLLGIGDALALSAHVDGLLVVTRLHTLRRSMLGELRRVLDACPTVKLGFVLAAAELEQGSGYGSYGTYYQPLHQGERAGVS